MIQRVWIELLSATHLCGCFLLGWAALAMAWQWVLQVLEAIARFELESDSVLWPYIAEVAFDVWSWAPERYTRPDLVIVGVVWVIAVCFWKALGEYVRDTKMALKGPLPAEPVVLEAEAEESPFLRQFPDGTLADLARRMGADVADGPVDLSVLAATQRLAEQGDVEAQFDLAVMYATGRGLGPDANEKAVRWFRRSANHGHAGAGLSLGIMHATGLGVEQDDVEAISWFRGLAEQDHGAAQFLLGLMYDNGRGVPRNGTEALCWIRLAAAQGDADACAWMKQSIADRRQKYEKRRRTQQPAETQTTTQTRSEPEDRPPNGT